MGRTQYAKHYAEKYKAFLDFSPAAVATDREVTLAAVGAYLNDRLIELERMSLTGDAWFFGSCCTFLDMMTWCAYFHTIKERERKKYSGRGDYQRLLNQYFFPANPSYGICWRSWADAQICFAQLLYKTLRCGVVHSFSMKQSIDPKDRGYSILLAHHHDFKDMGNHHLEIVDVRLAPDDNPSPAFILMAEDFVVDIRRCAEKLISDASTESDLENNIIGLFSEKPPMGFLSFDSL